MPPACGDPPPAQPQISVVVVSQGRPAALRRCLLALEQQFCRNFEVIVVADAAGCAVAEAFACKRIGFAARNISAARNAGICAAAAGIVAFLDDDAAAEPDWLEALSAPFADPGVAGAGGFVLGRSGLSFQWRARQLGADGGSVPLAVPQHWSVPTPAPGMAVRVEGTNMAFRREVLLALGGFDPAFSFFHDESELCWRLHLAGLKLAIAPGAVVHHGVLPSERRRADRMPRDLTDIGRSSALFLARHAPGARSAALDRLRAEQRRRLVSHMRAGRCMPGDVAKLLSGLEAGIAGAAALPPWPGPLSAGAAEFLLFTNGPAPGSVLIAGTLGQAPALRKRAAAARARGEIVTLLILTPGWRRHRAGFGDDGIWLQRGGTFGRALRTGPLPGFVSAASRINSEAERLNRHRRFHARSGLQQA